MRQRRFARTSERGDDGLVSFDGPTQRLSADSILITTDARNTKRLSASSDSVIHTIRDQFSGMAVAIPSTFKGSEQF